VSKLLLGDNTGNTNSIWSRSRRWRIIAIECRKVSILILLRYTLERDTIRCHLRSDMTATLWFLMSWISQSWVS